MLDDAKQEYGVDDQILAGYKWDNRRTGVLFNLYTTHKAVDYEPGDQHSPFTETYYSRDSRFGPS